MDIFLISQTVYTDVCLNNRQELLGIQSNAGYSSRVLETRTYSQSYLPVKRKAASMVKSLKSTYTAAFKRGIENIKYKN